MHLPDVLLLGAAGFFAGAINTIAGGGSFLTLPALMFLGLPPAVANGTNCVGIFLSAIAATAAFRRDAERAPPPSATQIGACLTGALLGVGLSLWLDDEAFRVVIGVVMWAALPVVLKPDLLRPSTSTQAPPALQALGFLGVGLYGGFIQAGAGILFMAAFVGLAGRDLVGANAGKVALVTLYTFPALAAFALADKVAWVPGLVLAATSMLGAVGGTWWSLHMGDRGIRPFLGLAILGARGRLLGLW